MKLTSPLQRLFLDLIARYTTPSCLRLRVYRSLLRAQADAHCGCEAVIFLQRSSFSERSTFLEIIAILAAALSVRGASFKTTTMTLEFEHKTRARRPAKGSTAICLRKFLRCLNYFIILGSIAAVGAILTIRLNPTWAGWGFILVGCLTLLSGILGCFPFDSCFSYHFLALGLSMGGLGSASLALFIKQQLVKQHLKPKRSDDHTKILMRVDAILFMVMLCVQMMVLVLAFIVHHCSYENYYEDLESKNARRANEMAKVQEESEARASKAQDSHAAELNKKMREKYGKWTHEAEFANGDAAPAEKK